MAADDTNNSDQDTNVTPFAYALVPLITVFVVAVVILFFWLRRRKRLAGGAYEERWWPRDRYLTPGGHLMYASRNGIGGMARRWAPWTGTRSQEGLNELGEAPPPYDGRKESADSTGDVEMGNMESGQRPPEYLARPQAVMTRVDGRERMEMMRRAQGGEGAGRESTDRRDADEGSSSSSSPSTQPTSQTGESSNGQGTTPESTSSPPRSSLSTTRNETNRYA